MNTPVMGEPKTKPDKLFIVSLPRSGSTVLTAILDRYEDVLCLPESFFPALLDRVSEEDWADKDLMAALFVASCSDGSPLEFEEALACMRQDREESLDALAGSVARKAGREIDSIRIVVWKFTRLVGCWGFASSIGGWFLILRRNPLNVFLSQFRVPFGAKNTNPLRFSLFEASYNVAFAKYPESATLRIEYPEIASEIENIRTWVGSTADLRSDGRSNIGDVAGDSPWHSEISKPFQNRDEEKITSLKASDKFLYGTGKALWALLPMMPAYARKLADNRQIAALHGQARILLSQRNNKSKA
jgi:hypothetical protein